MNIYTIVMIVAIMYILMNIFTMSKTRKKGNDLVDLIQSLNDEEAFFTKANEIIGKEEAPTFAQKVRILKLFGEAHYERFEDFKETLKDIDLSKLFVNGKNPIEANEDAFYYMCMAIPNKLYSVQHFDELKLLNEEVDTYKELLEKELVYKIGCEMRKFYFHEEDRGQAFLEGVLEGEYEGYVYSKQLIGLYKSVTSLILAAIYREDGNEEKFQEQLPMVESFATSPAGERMAKELNMPLSKEEEPKESEEVNEEPNEE